MVWKTEALTKNTYHKCLKQLTQNRWKNGPWGVPGGSLGPPGALPEPPGTQCQKKTRKNMPKVANMTKNGAPRIIVFFVFRVFLASKKSYKNAIVANKRFSTRFGHRTHSGTLRASVLTSFWAPKWYFFERKNVPRKNYDFHRFFDDIFQKKQKNKKTEKCLKYCK